MPYKDKEIAKQYHDNYFLINREKILKQRKQYYRKNKYIMHELKINGCAICGYNRCDEALQFHHVDRIGKQMKITINWTLGLKNNKLIDELNKCILLCCNCHCETHANDKKYINSK